MVQVRRLVEPYAVALQHLVGTHDDGSGAAGRHAARLHLSKRLGDIADRRPVGSKRQLHLALVDRRRVGNDVQPRLLQHRETGCTGGR